MIKKKEMHREVHLFLYMSMTLLSHVCILDIVFV